MTLAKKEDMQDEELGFITQADKSRQTDSQTRGQAKKRQMQWNKP